MIRSLLVGIVLVWGCVCSHAVPLCALCSSPTHGPSVGAQHRGVMEIRVYELPLHPERLRLILFGHFRGVVLSPAFPWAIPRTLREAEGGVGRTRQVGFDPALCPWLRCALHPRDLFIAD